MSICYYNTSGRRSCRGRWFRGNPPCRRRWPCRFQGGHRPWPPACCLHEQLPAPTRPASSPAPGRSAYSTWCEIVASSRYLQASMLEVAPNSSRHSCAMAGYSGVNCRQRVLTASVRGKSDPRPAIGPLAPVRAQPRHAPQRGGLHVQRARSDGRLSAGWASRMIGRTSRPGISGGDT